MRIKKTKLLLSRETVRSLAPEQLGEAAGAWTLLKGCQLPPSSVVGGSAIVSYGGGGGVYYDTIDVCNAISEINSCKSACICI